MSVQEEKSILVLIDWENLLLSIDMKLPESHSLSYHISRFIRWLKSIGEIFDVFVFAPSSTASVYSEILYKYGFYLISCPRIGKERKDSTDNVLIKFGEQMISNLKGLTHLCIVSGDKDFSNLIEKAKQKNLKIAIAVGHIDPLAKELIRLTSRDPLTQKRMIHDFSLNQN